MLEAWRPLWSTAGSLDEDAVGARVLELDEAVGSPAGIADDEVAGEVARQRILVCDSVESLDVREVGANEGGEMRCAAEEGEQIPALLKFVRGAQKLPERF